MVPAAPGHRRGERRILRPHRAGWIETGQARVTFSSRLPLLGARGRYIFVTPLALVLSATTRTCKDSERAT
eukprot:1180281-Prorocentrum_minimum.AAC.4